MRREEGRAQLGGTERHDERHDERRDEATL